MNSLTKLEVKKIRSNKAVKIACSLILIYIIVAVIGSIHSAYYYRFNNSLNNSDNLTGIEAIKQKKADVQKIKGYLDDKKIKEVITYYSKITGNTDNITTDGTLNDVAWSKYWVPYLDIQSLIAISYSPLNTSDTNIIGKLSEDSSKDFYNNRIKKISDYLELNHDYPKFDKEDAKVIKMKSKDLSTPLYYEYNDGWIKLFNNFFFLNVIIILILCFNVCNVFTEDIHSGMVLVVLPTVNGKTKLASSKIKASFIFTGIAYVVFNLVFSILLLSFYGIDGWNSQIQISSKYWLSIYNLKFYEAYIMAIIIGLSSCLFMVTLTLLVSNIFKRAFLTIGSITALLLLPIAVNTERLTKIPNNLLELLPIKAIDFTYALRQQCLYNIFGTRILRGYITPVILVIATIILIPFIIKLYNKQQA